MPDLLKIKVCGLRNKENIEQVCELEPDYIGYIFYRKSKRFVGADPNPDIFMIPDNRVKKVGVFVNEELGKVRQIHETCGLDLVQLHGEETPEYCMTLHQWGIPVIKAIDPMSINSATTLKDYNEPVRFFLFDNSGIEFGGTGEQFDWSILKDIRVSSPFFLSGGIGPGDVREITGIEHDMLFAVDVNSRFEIQPGLKDIERLKHFIHAIRKESSYGI